MPQSVLHLKGTTSIEVGDVHLQTSLEVIRVHVLCPAITRFLFQSAPDEIQPTFIEVIAKLVLARHPDQDGRSIRNRPITLFAFPQCLLDPLAVCNVRVSTNQAYSLSVHITDYAPMGANPLRFAIRLTCAKFEIELLVVLICEKPFGVCT